MHDHVTRFVIVNGDAPAIASASAGTEGLIPLKTAKQKLARKNKLKAKSTMLLAILDEHLLKFHGIKDAKTLREVIKARFQKLISQLEIYGEVISQEDENLKLLRSLPLAWNNIALIMRNKSDLDTLSMDDLYNNLKVTNEAVNTTHEVSTASLQGQASSSTYADDVIDGSQMAGGHACWELKSFYKINAAEGLNTAKQGEYDTWRLRIESYIQLQDYTLWEIIEEGNTFKPVARTTTDEDGTSTTTILGVVTAEQKILKKNDLKAEAS
ncbi:hypothetical protein Tco_0972351 [Tanacetum coccineum]